MITYFNLYTLLKLSILQGREPSLHSFCKKFSILAMPKFSEMVEILTLENGCKYWMMTFLIPRSIWKEVAVVALLRVHG